MRRQSNVDLAVVFCIWITVVGVGRVMADNEACDLHHRQPASIDPRKNGLVSSAGSTYERMLARHNHSALTVFVGHSTSRLGVNSKKKRLGYYQRLADVATSGASTQHHRFSLHALRTVLVNAATPSTSPYTT